jgi:adenylylsulfate kinase
MVEIRSENIVWKQSSITRLERCGMNGHKSFVLWFTGLSGSGKSTLGLKVEEELMSLNCRAFVLDGDNMRFGLNKDLGFSPDDRRENNRRTAEVAKLLVEAGIIAITTLISPYQADREIVRSLFNKEDFIEIYVKCPLEICEKRDPKGLYKMVRAGGIKHFTGITAPYEPPEQPEILIETALFTVQESAAQIIHYLQSHNYL